MNSKYQIDFIDLTEDERRLLDKINRRKEKLIEEIRVSIYNRISLNVVTFTNPATSFRQFQIP